MSILQQEISVLTEAQPEHLPTADEAANKSVYVRFKDIGSGRAAEMAVKLCALEAADIRARELASASGVPTEGEQVRQRLHADWLKCELAVMPATVDLPPAAAAILLESMSIFGKGGSAKYGEGPQFAGYYADIMPSLLESEQFGYDPDTEKFVYTV